MLERDYESAEKNLEDALSIDSTDTRAHSLMALCLAEQGRFGDAQTYAERAAILESGFNVDTVLSWILVSREMDLTRGIALAERAVNITPDDYKYTLRLYPFYPLPEHTLGLAYLKRANYERAVEYLEQAAELLPENPAIRESLNTAKRRRDASEQVRRLPGGVVGAAWPYRPPATLSLNSSSQLRTTWTCVTDESRSALAAMNPRPSTLVSYGSIPATLAAFTSAQSWSSALLPIPCSPWQPSGKWSRK